MTGNDIVAKGIKNYPSENSVLEPLIGEHLDLTIDSGGRCFGVLEGFSDRQLFLRGGKGQRIIVKRSRVSRLEVV